MEENDNNPIPNNNKASINSFEKGLFLDGTKSPEGTYRYCLNGVNVDPIVGEAYSISNERGFKMFTFKYNNNTEDDYYIVGYTVLGTDIILFSVKTDGSASEIGIFSTETKTYKTYINDSDTSMVVKGKFNFSIEWRIDAEARISFDNRRYVYFTDGYNKPRRVDLDRVEKYTDLDLQTALIPEFSVPIVEPVVVEQGSGQLYASSYSFCARYLTDNLDPTTTGLVSHPVPVGPIRQGTTNLGANWDEPLINKRIKLKITNVDTNYRYLELIVIYWKGSSNQKIIQVFNRLSIAGSTTIEAYYDGNINEYLKNITEGEITSEIVNYATAKHIIQKDGRLFLSNLTSYPEEDDYQKIASQLEVGYKTEEREYVQLNDPATLYKNNEMDTYSEKGYQRGEVYSLAIAFILKSGRITFAYHIPGNYKAQGSLPGDYPIIPDITDPWRSGYAGTYVSSEKYTYDIYAGTQSFSGENEHVRHHLLPTLLECPHVIRYSNTVAPTEYNYTNDPTLVGRDFVRYLYLTINNLYEVLDKYPEIKQKIKGYLILREERSTIGNSRIISQGITNKMMYHTGKGFQTYRMDPGISAPSPWITGHWYYTHNLLQTVLITEDVLNSNPAVPNKQPLYSIDPFFGNTTIRNYNPNDNIGGIAYYPTEDSTSSYNRGIVVDPYSYDTGNFDSNAGDEACSPSHLQGYLSPETIFTQLTIPTGFYAEQVYTFAGDIIEVTGSTKYHGNPDNKGDREFIIYLRCNYDVSKIEPDIVATYSKRLILNTRKVNNQSPVDPEDNYLFKVPTFYPGGSGISIGQGQTGLINPGNESYTLLELDNLYSTPRGTTSGVAWSWDVAIHFHCEYHRSILTGVFATDPLTYYYSRPPSYFYNKAYESRRNITNIVNDNKNQYGTLDISKYIIAYVGNITDLRPASPVLIKNGDTFLTKFAFRTSTKFKFRIMQASQSGNLPTHMTITPLTAFNGPSTGFDDSLDSDVPNRQESARLRGLSYVWLESKINGFWRHRPVERPIPYDNTNSTTGAPFFPDVGAYDHLDTSTGFSDAQSSGYNIVYSYDAGAKYYFTKPFGFVEVTKFPTRTIYSNQSIEGEQSDSYRIFLPNNYQDLPKNKGEITNQFVLNGKLYLHTEDSLWETFVNTNVQINTQDRTSVYLGNAGVFSRPAIEILKVDGGYAGCVHKWGSVSTPFGYLFPDYKNKEVFIFTDTLKSITDAGVGTWFYENYRFTEVSNKPNFYDNAINPNAVGLTAGFNAFSKKYTLHIKRLESENHTLSFSAVTNNWISFHSYHPSIIMDVGAYTYSVSNYHLGKIFLHEFGDDFGVYYERNTVYPFIIEFQSNGDFQFTKVFDNLFVNAYFKGSNLDFKLDDFFNTVEFKDSVQTSQVITLTLKNIGDKGLLKQNYFNHNVSLHNNEYRVAISKVNLRNHLDPPSILLSPRFKDRFLNVRFTYDNLKNNKLILNYVITKYRINSR
jgi:hypothetical protein